MNPILSKLKQARVFEVFAPPGTVWAEFIECTNLHDGCLLTKQEVLDLGVELIALSSTMEYQQK